MSITCSQSSERLGQRVRAPFQELVMLKWNEWKFKKLMSPSYCGWVSCPVLMQYSTYICRWLQILQLTVIINNITCNLCQLLHLLFGKGLGCAWYLLLRLLQPIIFGPFINLNIVTQRYSIHKTKQKRMSHTQLCSVEAMFDNVVLCFRDWKNISDLFFPFCHLPMRFGQKLNGRREYEEYC